MAHLPLWSIGQLKEDLCDQIIAEMSGIGEAKDASMGFDGSEKDHATRNTTVRFGDQTYWANNVFESFALHANKECKWDYEINNRENIQFAEYGPEQHYSWHTDTFILSGNPADRKITTVCLLNDDFEGGQFQVRLYGEFTAPLKKGTIIAFPAILEHRVTPVTSGIRYSATMWFGGPRFR